MEGKTINIECTGIVTCVECSPFEFCDSLVCYSSYIRADHGQTSHHITIAKIHPKREGDKMVEVLREFQQDKRSTCLCWSPKTFIESLPYDVVLCSGCDDGRVNIISTDLRDNSEIQTIGSHDKAVTAVSFDYENGELLASVADDCKCILWNTHTGSKHCEFPLKSAGTDVRFNQLDSTKLAVAEKSGLIRFYDLISATVFMSLESANGLILKSIDWSIYDITRIDALSGSQWLTFDTARSCLPIASKPIGQFDDMIKCGTRLRISSSKPQLLAIACGKGNDVRVVSTSPNLTVIHHLTKPLGSGFSWHLNQPLVVCGGDRQLTVIICDHIS